eukprot:TRINITY_DN25226_c0_g1_i1.p2 TRINITY_DN25226_c0_g1~~TRINITY_DN25226_c0_g1_i1.p2  ORF type:complete len:196 (-),score=36.67 TRINITY_DN25226_c0_g1_i1:209-796(-)
MFEPGKKREGFGIQNKAFWKATVERYQKENQTKSKEKERTEKFIQNLTKQYDEEASQLEEIKKQEQKQLAQYLEEQIKYKQSQKLLEKQLQEQFQFRENQQNNKSIQDMLRPNSNVRMEDKQQQLQYLNKQKYKCDLESQITQKLLNQKFSAAKQKEEEKQQAKQVQLDILNNFLEQKEREFIMKNSVKNDPREK